MAATLATSEALRKALQNVCGGCICFKSLCEDDDQAAAGGRTSDDDVINIKTTMLCCVKADTLRLDVVDHGTKKTEEAEAAEEEDVGGDAA